MNVDDNDLDVECKSLKLYPSKYHQILCRNVSHDTYVDTMSVIRGQSSNEEDTVTRRNLNLMSKRDILLDLPYPICPPTTTKYLPDPCSELLESKSAYQTKLKFCREEYKKDKKHMKYTTKIKKLKIPKYLLDMTQGKIVDPDPFFKGHYNWYYTGGCLVHFELGNTRFIVRPTTDGKICFTDIDNPHNSTFFHVNKDPIFAINVYKTESSVSLALRQKFSVRLINCTIKEKRAKSGNSTFINAIEVWSYTSESKNLESKNSDSKNLDSKNSESKNSESKNSKSKNSLSENLQPDTLPSSQPPTSYDVLQPVPIIDYKLNKYNTNKMAILKLNRRLQFFDVSTNETFYIDIKPSEEPLTDGLMQFEYLTDGTLFLMDRSSVYVVDEKSGTAELSTLNKGYFTCDDLCTFTLSETDENYVYIATVHNIYKFDRKLMRTVKKWSHMLSQPPTVLKSCKFSYINEEYMFLTSQDSKNKCILNDSLEENTICKSVPDNLKTLKVANLKCYNLHEDLIPRLSLSTTGIAIVRNLYSISLYSSNSIGDVFINDITKSKDDTLPAENLQSWIDDLPTEPKPLIVTGLKEMSNAYFSLTKIVQDKYLEKFTRQNEKRLKLWEELDEDKFDMGLIWDQEKSSINSSELPPTMTPSHKVSEWLQSRLDDSDRTKTEFFDDEES